MLTNHIFDWEYWLDQKNNVIYLSDSFETITGYKKEDFINDPDFLKSIIVEEDQKVWSKHKVEVCNYKKEEKAFEAEFRIILKTGETIWIRHICKKLYSPDGQYNGIWALLKDVTAIKKEQTENNISEQSTEKDDHFISLILHEIKSPLTSILLSVGILEQVDEKQNYQDRGRHLKKIQKNVENIARILDDVLYLNKLEKKENILSYEEVELKKFCEVFFTEIRNKFPDIKSFVKINLSNSLYKVETKITFKIVSCLLLCLFEYNIAKMIIFFTVNTKKDKLVFKIYCKEQSLSGTKQNIQYANQVKISKARHVLEEKLEFTIIERMIKSLNGKISVADKNRFVIYTLEFPIL